MNGRLNVSIRRGTISDIPTIKPWLVDSWVMHARHEPDLLEEKRMRESDIEQYYRKGLKSRDCHFLVAEVDGKPVGFIRADVKQIASFFKHNKILYLDDLYVSKKFRRKGIARLLMLEAEKVAKTKGIKRIQARVYTFNRPTHKLLRSMGYDVPHSTWDKVL